MGFLFPPFKSHPDSFIRTVPALTARWNILQEHDLQEDNLTFRKLSLKTWHFKSFIPLPVPLVTVR